MRNQPTHDLGTSSGRAAPPRAAFMPRIHIRPQQQVTQVSFARTLPSDPLGGLGVAHLAVVEPGGDEYRRIAFSYNIIVRKAYSRIGALPLASTVPNLRPFMHAGMKPSSLTRWLGDCLGGTAAFLHRYQEIHWQAHDGLRPDSDHRGPLRGARCGRRADHRRSRQCPAIEPA
jgi:hypothetical protein